MEEETPQKKITYQEYDSFVAGHLLKVARNMDDLEAIEFINGWLRKVNDPRTEMVRQRIRELYPFYRPRSTLMP